MSAVRVVPIGPGRFRLFIDGHEVTKVVNVDTTDLVRVGELPRLTIVLYPESFVCDPMPVAAALREHAP